MSWKAKFVALCLVMSLRAFAQHTVAEQYLFQSINQERATAGLPALTWNPELTQAAIFHAQQMRSAQAISHQFQGEPDLTVRAASAGTKFSRVAENVATSGSILQMHDALMRSQHHRENILDPQVNSIGIAVVASGRQLWGVEDFARDVQPLSFSQQESQISELVMAAGLQNVGWSEEARATCRKSAGFVGDRPAFVMRFSATDLDHLPAQLAGRIAQGGISQAAIGACAGAGKNGFTTYNIAVVLYP